MDKFQGMNQFLKDKLRAPTMTAHDAPDGGDTELQDAANMLADQAGDDAYTPPFPVPLMTPITREEGNRGLASEVWLVNPPAAVPGIGVLVGGGAAEKGSQFPINSIRVDNLTSQWMYWPEIGAFVPPFWYGRVFRFTGARIQRVKFETPTGVVALAAATTQIARVLFSEENWDEQPGASSAGNMAPTTGGAANAGVTIVDDLSGLPAEVQTPADALVNQAGLVVDGLNFGFNGATWDRLRTAPAAGGSAGTVGVLAAGSFVWDSADALYNTWLAAKSIGDANDARGVGATSQLAFNGATYDRLRVPKVFKQMASVAVGIGSTATVWTPAAGLRPRLMGWVVTGSSGLVDAAVTFFETSTTGTFMGEVGFLAGIETPSYVNYMGGGPIVSVSSAVIVAFSSTGITLRGTLFGTEE